jgi:2-keto-4-pentenoate hydratase
MSAEAEIARELAEARRSGRKLAAYPGPTPRNKAQAFAIQTQAQAILGWTQMGWKIGCTSERAQRSLNTDAPFPGPLYRERRFRSGDEVPTDPTNARVTEPEIAFTLARDLPERGSDYAVDEVLAAVASVHGAIEIVNPRLPKGFDDVVEWYIADGALNDAIVLGPAVKPLERSEYSAIQVKAYQDGRLAGEGRGAEALGGPEIALTWLANELLRRGLSLREGDVVSTGVIAGVFASARGQRVEAVYDRLGTIEVRF